MLRNIVPSCLGFKSRFSFLELKDDHESLKALQKELHEKQERFKNKTNNLAQMKNQVQNLERDVKNFDEKNQIQATMQLIKKRKKWADVSYFRPCVCTLKSLRIQHFVYLTP